MRTWVKRVIIVLLLLAFAGIAISSMLQNRKNRQQILQERAEKQEVMRQNGLLEAEVGSTASLNRMLTERMREQQEAMEATPDVVVQWRTEEKIVPVERWRDRLCPGLPRVPTEAPGTAEGPPLGEGGADFPPAAQTPLPELTLSNDLALSMHRVGGGLFAAGDLTVRLFADGEPFYEDTQQIEDLGRIALTDELSECLSDCDFPRYPARQSIGFAIGSGPSFMLEYRRRIGSRKILRNMDWSVALLSTPTTGNVWSGDSVVGFVGGRDLNGMVGLAVRWGD